MRMKIYRKMLGFFAFSLCLVMLCSGRICLAKEIGRLDTNAESEMDEELAENLELLYDLEWAQTLAYDYIAEEKDIIFVFDISGSMNGKADIVGDLERIFYEVLNNTAYKNCYFFAFDEKAEISTRNGWKPTGKNTDLLNCVEKVDNLLQNRKTDASIIMISDFVDTFDGRVLDPYEDSDLLMDRKQKIENIINGWMKKHQLYIYSWDQKSQYVQITFEKDNVIHMEEKKQFDLMKDCFALAQSIRNDLEPKEWISYGSIARKEEGTYWDYYLCADEPVECLQSYMMPLTGKLNSPCYFYEVNGTALSQFEELHDSLQSIYILPIPELVLTSGFTRCLDDVGILRANRDSRFILQLKWDGENVNNESLIFSVKKKGEEICELVYNEDYSAYEGIFASQNGGEILDLEVRIKGASDIIYTRSILIKYAELCPLNDKKLLDEIRAIEKDDCVFAEISLNENFPLRNKQISFFTDFVVKDNKSAWKSSVIKTDKESDELILRLEKTNTEEKERRVHWLTLKAKEGDDIVYYKCFKLYI